MANLYVSSTFSDLKEFREQVRNTLRRLGHLDVAMEYDNASDERPVDKCLRDVENADLYLGIFAWRYGYVPQGYDKSITELEYRKAVEAGKECLIFILKANALWDPTRMEFGALEKINALRNELSGRHTVQFFSNEDELRAVVSEALNDWAKKQGLKQNVLSTDWDAYARAVVDEHQWVRLVVIAGAKQDRFAQIPLTEVFVPQMTAAGPPTYEVPDEVLKQKRDLFTVEKAAESPEEESESPVEIESQERRESLDGIDVALPELSLDVLGREQTQVFLGGPGSGKSTLLLYSVLALCDPNGLTTRSIANLTHVPIPFLVELRQYVLRQMPNFIAYIVANIQECYGTTVTPEDLHALLSEERRAVVLFDGLDEVFNPSERQRVIQQFKAFARKYPRVQIVVTSRIVGYDKVELGVAGFQHYTMLDFNLPQIQEFVPCWYRYYTWQGDQRDAQGLIRRITESRRLMELAGNPLLLTMMGVIYKHQDLPEQRWKLYERCTEVLLEDWDIKSKSIDLKDFLPLDIQIRTPQKVEILQRVSLYMLQNHQAGRELNAIAYQPLRRILANYLKEKYNKSAGDAEATAQGILSHLRERTYILAEVGEGIFGFVHRTFMEYFAAGACLADFNAKRADYKWLTEDLYGKHWQQDAWQEVLLLLTAMLADQGSPISEVIEYLHSSEMEPPFNVAFAARCLAEAGAVAEQNQAQNLVVTLVEKIIENVTAPKQKQGNEFVEVGVAAFSMLAPQVEVPPEARQAIERLNKAAKSLRVRMAAWQMGFALRSRTERLEFALAALKKNAEEAVRRGAITVLEREWPGRAEVGTALINVVRYVSYTRVRQAAMESLRRAWPNQEELLTAIESRAGKESAYTFVNWVINYLKANWSGNEKALDIILKLSSASPGPDVDYDQKSVRDTAVKAIITAWSKYLPALLLHANASTNPAVYATTCEALARGWHDAPEVFDLLRKRLLGRSSIEIKIITIKIVVQSWCSAVEALQLMQDCAVNDPKSVIRLVAMGGLLETQGRNPDVEVLFYTRAVRDPSPLVRSSILAIMGHFMPYHQVSLLKDYSFFQCLSFPHRLIGKERRHGKIEKNQKYLSLLHSCALNDSAPGIRANAFIMIAGGFQEHPDTLPLLLTQALADASPLVRMTILNVLFSDDSFFESYLYPRNGLGESSMVDYYDLTPASYPGSFRLSTSDLAYRYFDANNQLSEDLRTDLDAWFNSPDVLALFLDTAANDPIPVVRLAAIKGLSRIHFTNHLVLRFLDGRSIDDEHPEVCNYTRQYLMRIGRKNK